MELNQLISSVKETLKEQLLAFSEASVNPFRKLPMEYTDSFGVQHTNSSQIYSMRISNSLVQPLSIALDELKGTGRYITLEGKRIISVHPQRESVSKFTGDVRQLPATILLTDIPEKVELVEFESPHLTGIAA